MVAKMYLIQIDRLPVFASDSVITDNEPSLR